MVEGGGTGRRASSLGAVSEAGMGTGTGVGVGVGAGVSVDVGVGVEKEKEKGWTGTGFDESLSLLPPLLLSLLPIPLLSPLLLISPLLLLSPLLSFPSAPSSSSMIEDSNCTVISSSDPPL